MSEIVLVGTLRYIGNTAAKVQIGDTMYLIEKPTLGTFREGDIVGFYRINFGQESNRILVDFNAAPEVAIVQIFKMSGSFKEYYWNHNLLEEGDFIKIERPK